MFSQTRKDYTTSSVTLLTLNFTEKKKIGSVPSPVECMPKFISVFIYSHKIIIFFLQMKTLLFAKKVVGTH